MAHILVYLQRTPLGLHPASALALCIARDIGTNRGASVTALCPGDAGVLDEGISRAAARFGADIMVFFGPGGLADTVERLRPVHVLAPWTAEGLGAVGPLKLGPASPRWIRTARPPGAGADTVTGVIAGTTPWYALDATLDPEYLGNVDAARLPTWVEGADTNPRAGYGVTEGSPVHYVATRALDADLARTLDQLGAQAVAPEAVSTLPAGTLLWFTEGTGALPDAVQQRSVATRLIVLPDADAGVDQSWMHADLVIPGPWHEAIARLQQPQWSTTLA